jgi:hypothetical protein
MPVQDAALTTTVVDRLHSNRRYRTHYVFWTASLALCDEVLTFEDEMRYSMNSIFLKRHSLTILSEITSIERRMALVFALLIVRREQLRKDHPTAPTNTAFSLIGEDYQFTIASIATLNQTLQQWVWNSILICRAFGHFL